jgi:hypothetical protein
MSSDWRGDRERLKKRALRYFPEADGGGWFADQGDDAGKS